MQWALVVYHNHFTVVVFFLPVCMCFVQIMSNYEVNMNRVK